METSSFEAWSVREWVRRVCQRPYLFVQDGSFRSVAAFLDGVVRGRGGTTLGEFDAFARWLSERCHEMRGMPKNYPWSWYFEQSHSTDAERLRALPRLYDEFHSGFVATPPAEMGVPPEEGSEVAADSSLVATMESGERVLAGR